MSSITYCLGCKFNNLKVTTAISIYRKANERSNWVPPIRSCCSGIDVKQMERRVAHDLQNVGMARNEEVGRIAKEFVSNASVVLTGLSPNMFHHHFHFLTTKA